MRPCRVPLQQGNNLPMHLVKLYVKAYAGISPPVWMLSLVLLINRSGSMVLPFLSIYLSNELGFSLGQTGIVLSMFGAGSLVGSLAGGYLTDKFGSFRVQLFSLVVGGAGFFLLFEMKTFAGLAAGFFLLTTVTDMLRPANATAVSEHALPENMVRAFSLNRMAVNLGYAIGPAVGGFLAVRGYKLLFYVDGATCMLAGLLFFVYFYNKSPRRSANELSEGETAEPNTSPYRDLRFLAFGVLTAGFAVVFFQIFNTLPIYYRDVYSLPENQIGWILGFNGLIVFLVEMPLVHALGSRFSLRRVVSIGSVLAGLSYIILTASGTIAALYFSMAVLSISEILVMPYLTTYTVTKAGKRNRGKYLGFYSMTYSAAFIVAPLLGTYLIKVSGFDALWYSMFGLSVVVAAGFLLNMRPLKVKPETAKMVDAAESVNP